MIRLNRDPMTIAKDGEGFRVCQRSCSVASTETRQQAEQIIADKLDEYRAIDLFFCQLQPVSARQP